MTLNKIHKEKRDKQMAHMKEKMAERKKKKLRKLQNQHDAEISEVRIQGVMIGFIFTPHTIKLYGG
jgi:acetylornithine/succinyldiaminopimelate/putrescine aminotransferase